MKIYTKTGDSGTTGLFAGPRVDKSHPRISAYGTVDELNAVLGLLLTSDLLEQHNVVADEFSLKKLLSDAQNDLFSIGAELATPEPDAHKMRLLSEKRVEVLERAIDAFESQLPPLSSFVLPGGTRDSALLHLARTVCRRAEREVVFLSHQDGVHDCSRIIVYLNRLSDLLFVLARFVNASEGVPDTPWEKPETQSNESSS